MIIKKTPLITIILFILVFISIGCGNKSDAPKTKKITQPVQRTDTPPTHAQKVQPTNDRDSSGALTDGQVISHEQFTFMVPKDWKGDKETQVWCPATENLDIPTPSVSLYCGGIPMMPGTTIDDLIKTHIGTESLQKNSVTVCGYKGFICQWEFNSFKHMGLFLEEKVGGGISVIHFFNCQAPNASFDSHAETFKQIIGSVKCK